MLEGGQVVRIEVGFDQIDEIRIPCVRAKLVCDAGGDPAPGRAETRTQRAEQNGFAARRDLRI